MSASVSLFLNLCVISFLSSCSCATNCIWSRCQIDISQEGQLLLPKCMSADNSNIKNCPEIPGSIMVKLDIFHTVVVTFAKLREAPPFMCKLSNLRTVNMVRNDINDFNSFDTGLCLVKIQSLDLSYNSLTVLNISHVATFREIVNLTLDNNMIARIIGNSAQLPTTISRLSLKANKIKVIDIILLHIASLRHIFLDDNAEIEQISNANKWKWTKSNILSARQTSLDISLSRVVIGGFDIARLWGVDVFDLKNDSLFINTTDLLMRYKDSFQFLKFTLRDSKVNCDCRALPAYEYFKRFLTPEKIDQVALKEINTLINLPCFTTKTASSRSIRQYSPSEFVCSQYQNPSCPQGCTCVESARDNSFTIDCTNSKRKTLPAIIPVPHNKTAQIHIIANGNSINDFTILPNECKNITHISLRYNAISEQSHFEKLGECLDLRNIDIRNNNLSSIPDSLVKLRNISSRLKMTITDNPFTCTCAAKGTLFPLNIFLGKRHVATSNCRHDNKITTFADYLETKCSKRSDPKPVVKDASTRLIVLVAITVGIGMVILILLVIFMFTTRRNTCCCSRRTRASSFDGAAFSKCETQSRGPGENTYVASSSTSGGLLTSGTEGVSFLRTKASTSLSFNDRKELYNALYNNGAKTAVSASEAFADFYEDISSSSSTSSLAVEDETIYDSHYVQPNSPLMPSHQQQQQPHRSSVMGVGGGGGGRPASIARPLPPPVPTKRSSLRRISPIIEHSEPAASAAATVPIENGSQPRSSDSSDDTKVTERSAECMY